MIAGLDGLRGLAVLLVLLYHARVFAPGWIGVSIFFVLSGFLITGILYRQKDAPLGPSLKSFYGRRFLRIFPLYYAYLFLLVSAMPFVPAVRALGLRQDLPWALTYTFDVYQALSNATHTAMTSHLWSLSVEEQFYLVWPAVVLLLPRRWLARVVWSLVLAGPLMRFATMAAWRHLGVGTDNPFWDLYVLPTSHIDAFAMGAALCLRPMRLSKAGLGVATGAFVAVCLAIRRHDGLLPLGLPHAGAYLWGYSAIDALSAGLVLLVARGELGTRFFRSRPLTALGRVSYGVYILHYPVVQIVVTLARRRIASPPLLHLTTFMIGLPVTVALASASYRWLERPLLLLKDVWFARPSEATPGRHSV